MDAKSLLRPDDEAFTLSSTFTSLERRLSHLSLRSRNTSAGSADDSWGDHGLNLLWDPPEALVDLIFVHGLRGGSRKTWTWSDDPLTYWPKEWLPRDARFKNVRIWSFGYNSDWATRKDNVWNINDFGKSLLGDVADSPEIRDSNTSLIFVAHSMGGLVVKKAYLHAKHDDRHQSLLARFNSIFFLATPHRGADKASLLNNILRSSILHASKSYVTDLRPGSTALEVINEEFRMLHHGVQLWSFYETRMTSVGKSSFLVVEKSSAVIGLTEEQDRPLDANHRDICKFEKPTANNYTTLCNALVSAIEPLVSKATSSHAEINRRDMNVLGTFLGIFDKPEDDLKGEDDQAEGTCEWLVGKSSFMHWMEDDSRGPKCFWLQGNPASGKSVMTSYVIRYLETSNKECSYFFFQHGDKTRASINFMLRSIAYQMALSSVKVRKALLSFLEEEEIKIEQTDDRTLWRKLFTSLIFKHSFDHTHFWVIDGFDECRDSVTLMSLLAKSDDKIPLRIFISSRITNDIDKLFQTVKHPVAKEHMSLQQVQADIRLYIKANMFSLPVETNQAREELTEKIVAKANDCFLWAHLVLRELEHTFSEQQINEVLDEVPKQMSPLYSRILDGMAKDTRNVELIKGVLTWTVCAIHPLRLDELKEALRFDLKMNISRLDRLIESSLGEMVYIDKHSRIQLIHPTAREFLLSRSNVSDFAIDAREGNTRLGIVCLRYLVGDQMSTSRHRRKSSSARLQAASCFQNYACTAFSSHIRHSIVSNDQLLFTLDDFLKGNVLTWIEMLAEKNDLSRVLKAARDLKSYLQRREEQRSPLGKQYQNVSLWVVDLTRIVMAFGNHLTGMPFAIHFLIPPICPSLSKIYTQFANDTKSLEVVGASATEWHDRLSCITHRDSLCTAIACLDNRLVVGLKTGTVIIYGASTCREIRRIEHRERVQNLKLATVNPLLAVSGRKTITLWNCTTGDRIWKMPAPAVPMTMWFDTGEDNLYVAMKSNSLSSWSIRDGIEREERPWSDKNKHQRTESAQRELQKTPTISECSIELNLLAIAYRSKPLVLWDLEEDTYIGSFDRRASPRSEESMSKVVSEADSWVPSSMASALAFNPDPRTRLLAIAYQDGDLCVIDPIYQELRAPTVVADACVLAPSPDGKTLATGDAAGTVKLFNFETLELYYSVSCVGYDVKAICFSTDSLRFFDIRGPQCNVWEPAVLVRRSDESTEDSLDDAPIGPAQIVEAPSWDETKLTSALLVDHRGDYVFCAREDGSIWAYDAKYGNPIQELYHHAEHIAVRLLTWNAKKSLLGSADLSGRFTVRKIHIRRTGKWQVDEALIDKRAEATINQLLLSPAGDRLLCSTSARDYLWDINEKEIAVYQPPTHEMRTWLTHPQESKLLLLQCGNMVQSFLWSSLQGLKSSIMSQYADLTRDGFSFQSAAIIDRSTYLVLEHIKHEETRVVRNITMWDLRSLHNSQYAELPVHASYPNIAKEISSIVGMYNSSLIFLNHLHWFCTLDLSDPDDTAYVEHFFVPPEWNNSGHQPICTVTAKGDVVVVKDDGIVIAKNGLTLDNIVRLNIG